MIPVTQEDGKINGAASVAFEQIARGATEVVIEYAGHNYRLRATRNGRLVLNK
ncbi:MAG: hemin uptake protein HemP [Planctomycetaceae bacterium]|nr:hemin uptake protein HemP [Planctomycetaceae bacterium]